MNNFLIVVGALVFLAVLWLVTYRNILLHYTVEISMSENGIREIFSSLYNKIPYLLGVMNEHKVFAGHAGAEMLDLRSHLVDKEKSIYELFEIFEKIYTHCENIFVLEKDTFNSDIGFLESREELEDLHDEVRLLVKKYNNTAEGYNQKLIKFPGNFTAGLFKMPSIREL